MIRSGIYFFMFLLAFTSCKKQDKDVISNVVEILNKNNSLHFKAIQKYYYQSEKDTTYTPFEIWALRDKNDSLRNGFVWVDNNYRPYHMMYNNGDFHLAIPPKKTTVLYKNFKDNFISPIDWIDFFLKPFLLDELIARPEVKTIISDTIYQGEICDQIEITIPENSKGELKAYTYILSKTHHFPLLSMMKSKTKDQIYIDEITFTDYEFDKVNIDQLKEDQKRVLQENPVEREGTDSELVRLEKMIHIGEKAPLFEGKFYATEKEFKLENYIGKNVIVVDFWYTHCPPCVKAMPALSELYNEYKDQGLKIFGLNSVDNRPGSLANLDKFLSNRKLSYDVIMTQAEVDLKYKISSYPTMYIVDKEGNISYIGIGYDTEKFKGFKEHIIKLLKN